MAAVFLFVLAGSAGAEPPSTSLASWSTDGEVISVATSGSTAYVGGDFSRIGPASSFAAGPFVALDGGDGHAKGILEPIDPSAAQVYTSVSDGSGGWYIGGFNVFEHVRSDGTLEQPYPFAFPLVINALAVSGSTLYVGGQDSASQFFIKAIDLSTGQLTSFSNVLNGLPRVLLVSGSTLYVGGDFTTVDGGATPRNGLAAFDTTTGTVTSWDPDVNGEVVSLAVSGSTVYAGGFFTTVNGGTGRSNLAAFDVSTATALAAFDPDVNGEVYGLAVSGSNLVAGGRFTTVNGSVTRNNLAEVDASTGTVVSSWDPNLDGYVKTIAVSGGTVYAGGVFSHVNNGAVGRDNLAAFDLATGGATSFAPSFNSRNTGSEVDTVQVDGSTVYAGGQFSSSGGVARNSLAGIDLATGAATSFDPDLETGSGSIGQIAALAVSGSTLYAGGTFSSVNASTSPVTRNNLAAFDTGTGAATGFDPDVDGPVQSLAISGSTVYAGGQFASVNGGTAPRSNLAAFEATTGIAASFNVSFPDQVEALALSGSTLYVGGSSPGGISAVDTTGAGSILPYHANTDGDVFALALSGSTLYAGGLFTHVNGTTARAHIAAFDTTGAATSFDPEIDGQVDAIQLIGSTLYVGGFFSKVNGSTARSNLASFNTAGIATSWAPDPDSGVNGIGAGDGEIVAGGRFGALNGAVRPNIAVFDGAPGPPTAVTATAGVQQASVSFTPPAVTGADTPTYTVTASPGGAQASGGASPISVTGLTAGTSYTFTVTASNAIAAGPASSASNAVTPQAPAGGGGGGVGGGGGSSGIPPDLAVTVSANAANTPPVGTGLIFFVKVFSKNSGGSTDVHLQLALPAGYAFDHLYIDRGSCSGTAPSITCDVAFINPSASTSVTIFGSVATAGELDVSASVQSQLEPEFDPSNNSTTFKLLPLPSTGGGGSPPPPTPSKALVPPRLLGKGVVGDVLRVTPPRWSKAPSHVTYHWQLCKAGHCASIPGATHLTLTLRASYAGRKVRFVATASSVGGETTVVSKAITVTRH